MILADIVMISASLVVESAARMGMDDGVRLFWWRSKRRRYRRREFDLII